jgi:sulfate transport system ATP-binding protein
MRLELRGIGKRFGGVAALDGINLDIEDGELVALLGPSGSGKTSLLRIIGGLEQPSSGQVLFDGRNTVGLSPAARNIGFVFQHYALFRHMTVFENIAFGLRVQKRRDRLRETEIRRRVEDLLALVQLTNLGRRFPRELSGGPRQRVALARSLAVEPQLLLLDEPFGALDAAVRHELRGWLAGLQRQLGLTTLIVTHDQAEAFELGQRIAVLRQGRVEQIGSAADLYDRPANPFVLEFIGRANRVACRVRDGAVHAAAGWRFLEPRCGLPDGPVIAYVRPEDIAVTSAGPHSNSAGLVRRRAVLGNRLRLTIERQGEMIEADIGRDEPAAALPEETEICIGFRRWRIFPPSAPLSQAPAVPRLHPSWCTEVNPQLVS